MSDNGRGSPSILVAAGLEAALQARAPAVHSSTPTVRRLAIGVCRVLGLGEGQEALVDVCARVRDVGMIGLPDAVLLEAGPLKPGDWRLVNQHPVLGAELLAGLDGMQAAAPIVRAHHERWDGDGYPDGQRGAAIPQLGRVIAACDAFVAMATDRPHRRGLGTDAALAHLEQERERQLDPEAVDALLSILAGPHDGEDQPRLPAAPPRRTSDVRAPSQPPTLDRRTLRDALAHARVLPVFAPAAERVIIAAAPSSRASTSDLITAIESDTALTIAVMRAAQAAGAREARTLPDAVAALSRPELQALVIELPRAPFPWQSAFEGLMHQLRVHAQAVARAAEHIARELQLAGSDEVVLAALVHDVGKLALAMASEELAQLGDSSDLTPERRAARERQSIGLDHASVGGLLLKGWGLPASLVRAVASHHSSEGGGELATLVRLADMIAHHAHGDQVDRRLMLRLAAACGLTVTALRDTLFDLPHSGGSRRRRAEATPLSSRETTILRGLAAGKVYKEIAVDTGLAVSTVRTHLHNAYAKLKVTDRAQAVLLATEMGWL